MKARVAVLISGAGTNMAALLYAAKAADCPYELVLVGSNNPDAPGLAIARAEGIATWQVGVVQGGPTPADDLGHFEQGAKGVDGGAVRLVGSYAASA